MTPGSVIVASVGSGPEFPHNDIATHPKVLPPYERNISECHLSSFLSLSPDYQVRVHAGTALWEAAEVRWDTIELHTGDMLHVVATSHHHGMLALQGAWDGLHGALFHLWCPDTKHCHHQPNTTHLDPNSPPLNPWLLLVTCPARTAPALTKCCG